jgi:signal peptidase I
VRKQLRAELSSQRDLLSPKAISELTKALEACAPLLRTADTKTLNAEIEKLDKVAAQWLKPYAHPGARENFKEFLASAVLIMAVFTFFLQPMKIPSGSAQPSLYGNVVTSLKGSQDPQPPSLWRKTVDWFKGVDYHYWIAKDDGRLEIEPVETVGRVLKRQRFVLGSDSYTVWFPPDHLLQGAGVYAGQEFKKGDVALNFKVSNGDRLFVDRVTYNFRRPERGEIVVFNSTGIPHPTVIQNTHYIKRLVGLGGDHLRIGNDRHLIVNGQWLSASTPHFANVYSFDPQARPLDSVYSGHVNDTVAAKVHRPGLAPLFPDETTEFVVRTNHYLCMGDNTMNSNDGRVWGDFPREKVVGRAFFVFWPITRRFGFILH